MEVLVGLRVVRGPDWERGDEDGGEGFVGTVVAGERADGAEEGRHDVATVQWDVRRERHSYRCGAQGKYDLRVLDSAPAGVVHGHIGCSVCGSESIAGSVWRCLHCLRYYLCTPCYMRDRHSVWHHFVRMDTPQNTQQRTKVRCRYQSGRVAASGVFPGATVVRGEDWRWGDQDGGPGREGTVVEIDGWHSESSRSVAMVEWKESGLKRKYRVGHKGKVDVVCKVAGVCGYCYLEHLPVLGAEYKAPVTPFLCAGDRALLEMDLDLLKSSLDVLGTWDDNIVEFLGTVALVSNVSLNETEVAVSFSIRANRFHVPPSALKKVEGPDVLPDDVVRVIDDIAEVHRLQKEGRGWEDDMALSLGQLGRVVVIIEDGSLIVRVNGMRWCLSPLCVVPAPGEQPQEEQTELDKAPSLDMLWMPMRDTPNPELLLRATSRGCARILDDLLKKWPDQVNAKFGDKTLLHFATAEGRVNVTRVLLEHKADIRALDKTGDTALHNTAHFNHYQVAELLLDAGSDVNLKGIGGNTPIHIAAALGHCRLLKLFLNQPNPDVNPQNKFGDTPLHLASQCYWLSATRLLIEAGADISLANGRGNSVFRHAILKEFFTGVELITQVHPEVINEVKPGDSSTALHVAAHFNTCDVVAYLSAIDTCTVESRTCLHDTPLHIAARDGSVVGLEQLVGYGADVTATDSLGITPLHYVLVKKIKTPLSEWTPHLNQVHEYVSSADNSIQDVPVYVTVACFLVCEGASLDILSLEGLTPIEFCPEQYRPLLKLFAQPNRRGHYRGSLPRHPPPVPISTQKNNTHSRAVTTPSNEKTTPTHQKATPTEDSVSGGNSNKTEESGQQPSLNNTSSSSKDVSVSDGCFLCEGPCDILFQPCGHTAMCAVCAEPVKRCPTCRNDVLHKIKITV